MKRLLTAIAITTLVATSANAGPGNGRGGGQEKAENARSQGASGNRGNGQSMRNAMREERGPSMSSAASDNRGNGQSMRDDRGPSMQSAARDNRGNGRQAEPAARRDERGQGNANRSVGNAGRGNGSADRPVRVVREERDERRNFGRRDGRVLDDGRRIFEGREARRWWDDDGPRGLIDGCPPGLAKKNPPCVPPGLARQDDQRYRYRTYRPDWWGLSGLGDGRYFYDDGYLLRLNGDRVAGYIPLLGGALSVGNPWPSYYAPRPVPDYFADYYGLGPAGSYRYADNVLYRVDPQTAAITSIAALLTGDDIRIGQPMPAGYSVYNVPYPYRSQYVDGPNAMYRYSDGYVYRVDPETRLVAAAIELLAT